MEEYIDWAVQNLGLKISADSLTIGNLGHGERGVICGSKGINEGSTLLTIPIDSIMTIFSARGTPLEMAVVDLREEDCLAILLLFEKHQCAENSKWSQHIARLPIEYHSISNYSDEELELIRGSNLYSVAKQWKVQIHSDYLELITKLSVFHEPNLRNFVDIYFTEANYHWALCTIWSRFISIAMESPDGTPVTLKGMVPVIDMFNHSPTSKMSHLYNSSTKEFFIYSGQNWSAGVELFLSYGLLPNARLLMLYGFAIYDNMHANVEIWASMDPSSLHFAVKHSIVKACGVDCQQEPFVLKYGILPVSLLVFIHCQHMDSSALRQLESCPSVLDLYNSNGSIFSKLDKVVRSSLADILNNLLSGYQDTLESDERLLQSWGVISDGSISETPKFIHPNAREINAVIMRHSEKRILQSIIDLL